LYCKYWISFHSFESTNSSFFSFPVS
jgi:hypothetical protein